MSEDEGRSLHQAAQKLADDLKVADGKVFMAPDRIEAWLEKVRSWPPAERQPLAIDLVILARRLMAGLGEAGHQALAFISVLVAELLGSVEAAGDLFDKQGVSVDRAAALLGQHKRDLSGLAAEPPKGAASLLGLLGSKKEPG